ncbi:MAG: urate hydroxylase PuuD [Chloroflexi bacterium]|nr:urate hydroxylase PuuD [Chloroflexota bacterium]MDA1240761.1 urate hydroxylase PuuD [Chloroflexota bacterium]
MELFTQDGLALLSRWGHLLSGITWIGLLYYFNFVQTPAFLQLGAPARMEALDQVTWRALWWFRWGAVFTVVTGLMILGFNESFTKDYFTSPPGISIASGAVLGVIMLTNVWAVIWRAQQVVIASARSVIGGGPPNPDAAPAGRRGAVASRMNTIFSVPLLFFMAATSHFVGSSAFEAQPETSAIITYWAVFAVVVGVLEVNALGLIKGLGPAMHTKPYDSVRAAIISGFVVFAILYIAFEVLFRA